MYTLEIIVFGWSANVLICSQWELRKHILTFRQAIIDPTKPQFDVFWIRRGRNIILSMLRSLLRLRGTNIICVARLYYIAVSQMAAY